MYVHVDVIVKILKKKAIWLKTSYFVLRVSDFVVERLRANSIENVRSLLKL